MIFPKYIVEGDALILGKVQYHADLAAEKEKVKGGGWFVFSKEDSSFVLYGNSEDFGAASLEDVQACIKAGKVYTNRYRTHNITWNHKWIFRLGTENINIEPPKLKELWLAYLDVMKTFSTPEDIAGAMGIINSYDNDLSGISLRDSSMLANMVDLAINLEDERQKKKKQ